MIPAITNSPSFEHHWKVKDYFKAGMLPTVKKGFYGDRLTKKNVSVEHLKPVSKGGRTTDHNLALASRAKNSSRGNNDISLYADQKTILEYLAQFIDVKLPKFDGNKYIASVTKTLNKLGFDVFA